MSTLIRRELVRYYSDRLGDINVAGQNATIDCEVQQMREVLSNIGSWNDVISYINQGNTGFIPIFSEEKKNQAIELITLLQEASIQLIDYIIYFSYEILDRLENNDVNLAFLEESPLDEALISYLKKKNIL